MDQVIVEIYQVEKCSGPEFCRETRPVEEGSYLDCKSVVVNLGTAILGRAIHTGRLNNITKLFQHSVAEQVTPGKFAALIHPNNTFLIAKFRKKAKQMAMGCSFNSVRNAQVQQDALSTTRG